MARNLLAPPAGYALFGAYPGHGDSDPAAWEAMAGRQLALWTRYYEVQQTWPTADDLALINAGRTLYCALTPSNVIGNVTWAEIAAGTYDSYLSAAATIIRDNGVPVIVGWDAEPDDTVREPSGTAADYVASFQHVQALFAGITPLIIMAWIVSEGSTRSATFWPGAACVDWAGVDPYDTTESKGGSGEPADGPQDTYKTFMSWLPAQGFGWTGPVGIFETGVDNTVSDANRATWIENVPAALADLGYSAWVWFNSSGSLGTTTISPAADPLAAAAIATIGANSVFNPPASAPSDEPYLIGTAESDAASNTLVIDVGQTTNPGDGIAVGATINSASATVTGVSDSQSNPYSLEVHNSGTAEYGNAIYVSQGTTQLVAGTDQITITFSSSLADGKSAGATGIPGALSSGAVDSAACVSATSAGSADPSVTTGALAQQDEAIVAWLANGSGGGAVDWAATWTPQATGFQAAGGNQWSSMATLVTSATTAVTASGSITSAKWAILTVGIKLGVSLAVTTASLPEADTGAPYDQALTASGGVAPYTWSVTSGSLPAGLSLSSAGVITGTAGTPGTSGFTAKVTDSASSTATASLSLTVVLNLAVTTVSLPEATTGAPYSQALTATGGTTPYAWSVSAGSLPSGLSLSSGGTISGTPAAAGTSSFTAKATDADSNTATQALSLTVTSDLTIITTTLAIGTAGTAYSQVLGAAGGDPPYSWAVTTGSLPSGLSLASDGVLSGTPATPGITIFSVTVTDAGSDTATQVLAVSIAAATGTVTPPAAVPVPAVTYTYAATDLITGQVLADTLPLNVQSFTAQLNGGGTLTGALDLRQAYQVNQPFVEALEARRSVLWVLANGQPVWNGVVWDWPDMTRADGNLPISAQTMDSVWSHRLISSTLDYAAADIFTVFMDLVKYGVTKSSPYITSLSPTKGPASPQVAAAAAVAGLVLPEGQTAGVPWSATYMYSDLSQVSDEFSNLVASGNLEYAFAPGFDADGNLVTYLRLGYTQLGRPPQESGYSLTYPGNCLDYGYQRTGSQSSNVVWATAPPNGSAEQWESGYPHGYDLGDLAAGYPLMETTVSWQGSVVTQQSMIDGFADGQVALQTQAMTMPVINIGDSGFPRLTDLVLGDTIPFSATSALHPPNAQGEPGLQVLVRLAGWTAYPPGPSQSGYVQLATSGVVVS